MTELIDVEHWREVKPADWPWPNFTPYEMACRSTGRLVVSSVFMDPLQEVRTRLDRAMHVTSGGRTMQYQKELVERGFSTATKSFHICDDELGRGQIGTFAVDIAAVEGLYRGDLFAYAWDMGFSIGWNAKRSFLHLDQRSFLGFQQTTFDYE